MLRAENIQAGYGGLPVLHGVTLEVARNESVAIIGANGAGKSTLVRALCGLLPLAAGRILHDGVPLGDMPAHERTRHGLAVVLEKNPFPLAAKFDFKEGALPYVKVNVKMAETSDVRVIATAGGRHYVATREIKVTIGGCGG